MNEREYYKRNQLHVLKTERVDATERNLVAYYPIYWQFRNLETVSNLLMS